MNTVKHKYPTKADKIKIMIKKGFNYSQISSVVPLSVIRPCPDGRRDYYLPLDSFLASHQSPARMRVVSHPRSKKTYRFRILGIFVAVKYTLCFFLVFLCKLCKLKSVVLAVKLFSIHFVSYPGFLIASPIILISFRTHFKCI